MPQPIAEVLARFAADTCYRDIPGRVLTAAKRSILDTVAVALAASNAVGARETLELIADEGGKPASSVWASGMKVPARAATFANSLMASALDFDSLHPKAVVHSDIVIVPAVLAVSEAQGVSGQDLLAAVVVGNEILCRLGCSTDLNSGWFYTSVYGTIASAAVTAKLLGGSSAQIAGAMGLGFLSSSGTQQPAVERSIGKRMQGAFAASAGVTAGYLGARNLSGPQEFIEGRFGLFRLYEGGDLKVITQDLGTRFESESITYKLYPSCQCNHAAIEGMLQLNREFGLEPDEIKSVEVFVSDYMQRLVGAPFQPGSNPQVAAQFSIQYSIAALLLFRRLGVTEIQDDAILNPRIADLVSRIVVNVDPENHNNYAPLRLKVRKKDGSVIERQVVSYRGNTDMPLSDSEMRDKLAMCIEGCGKPVESAQINALFDAVMNIEEYSNMASAVPQILEPISH